MPRLTPQRLGKKTKRIAGHVRTGCLIRRSRSEPYCRAGDGRTCRP